MKTFHLLTSCMVEGRAPVAKHTSMAVRARHVAAWFAVQSWRWLKTWPGLRSMPGTLENVCGVQEDAALSLPSYLIHRVAPPTVNASGVSLIYWPTKAAFAAVARMTLRS